MKRVSLLFREIETLEGDRNLYHVLINMLTHDKILPHYDQIRNLSTYYENLINVSQSLT